MSTRHSEAAELLSAIKVLPVEFSFPALDASGERSLGLAWQRRARVRRCPLNHRRHRCMSVVRCSLGTGQKISVRIPLWMVIPYVGER